MPRNQGKRLRTVNKAKGRVPLALLLVVWLRPYWCYLKACFIRHILTTWAPIATVHNQCFSIHAFKQPTGSPQLRRATATQAEQSGSSSGRKTNHGSMREATGVQVLHCSVMSRQQCNRAHCALIRPRCLKLYHPTHATRSSKSAQSQNVLCIFDLD